LCYDKLEDLLDPQKNPKYGATCGRVAGRIANATFKLNNDIYDLEANNGPNCLHGGSNGWDRHVWKAKQVSKMMQIGTKSEIQILTGVEFRRTSPHDEGGFPGEV
jgi:aldose 1-epimerase